MDIKFKTLEDSDINICIHIVKLGLSVYDSELAKNDFLGIGCLKFLAGDYNQTNSDSLYAKDYECERFTITLNDKIIGVIGYYVPDKRESELSYYDEFVYKNFKTTGACLDWFAILPEHQKKGIGTKALHFLEQYAKSKNKTYMFVGSDSQSINFYKKKGYLDVADYNKKDDFILKMTLLYKKI